MRGFFHLGDVYDAASGQFLEFGIIDIGTVHRQHIAIVKISRFEHKRVVGGGRCELHIGGHPFIGMDDGMDLDAAFLSACLSWGCDRHP